MVAGYRSIYKVIICLHISNEQSEIKILEYLYNNTKKYEIPRDKTDKRYAKLVHNTDRN